MKYLLFLFFAINSAFGSSWIEKAKLPLPDVETLGNGLKVVWFVDQSVPVIDHVLMVQSGYRDDRVGKSGVAKLVSAVLDKGAGQYNNETLAREIEKLGASRYVSADGDTFTVGLHGLSEDSNRLLELLSLMIRSPRFTEDQVKLQRTRLAESWKMIGDSAGGLAALVYHRILTSRTPYGRGAVKNVKELSSLSRADVVRYHSKHFVPRNSVLMVVGKVDRVRTRKMIESFFGSWSGKVPKRSKKIFSHQKLKQSTKDLIFVERPGLTQAQIRMGFEGPRIDSKDHHELVVANAILGGFFYSRLNSVIRDQLGLAYSISSDFSYSKDFASFTITTATKNESVRKTITKIKSLFQTFARKGVKPDEVEKAKNYLIGGFPLGMSTLGAVASRWLAGYVFNLGPQYLNEFIPRISAVEAKQVSKAIKTHFSKKRFYVVVAGDPKVTKQLKDGKLGRLKKVRFKDFY